MGTKDITYTAQFTKTAKSDHGSIDPTEPSGAFLTGIAPQTSVKALNDSGYTVYDGKKEITSGYVGTGMTAVDGSSSLTIVVTGDVTRRRPPSPSPMWSSSRTTPPAQAT